MADKDSNTDIGISIRLLRTATALFGVHVQFARTEAARDAGRVMSGFALLALAVFFVFCMLGTLHVLAAFAFHDLGGFAWVNSIGAVAALDFLIVIASVNIGRSQFRRPILRETRDLVQRTVNAFSEP